MIQPGDKVRFSAETPDWSIHDWYGSDREQALRLDGQVGVVTCVEISGPMEEALYVDVEFDSETLYAVCNTHLEVVRDHPTVL
jgi:hypothetical protein